MWTPVHKLDLVSPGKLNLFLYVTGRRENGLHELYSLMVPLDLSDRVSIVFQGLDIEVVCDHPMVPEDSHNLVWRAARLFLDACEAQKIKLPFEGMSISIDKKIPVGGGLGGGSSNAAAVLSGLNIHAGSPFSDSVLEEMGLALGADVPFFLVGKPAIARGVGEKLEPFDKLPRGWVVIYSPGILASTANVFKKLEFGLTFEPVYIRNTGSKMVLFENGFDSKHKLHNDLEDPACSLYPEIRSAKKEMALLLQRNVYMSGSGSSLFALYPDRESADVGFNRLSNVGTGSGKQVFLSRIGQAII